MYTCPNCGATVTASNNNCPQCGVPLLFQDPLQAQAQIPVEPAVQPQDPFAAAPAQDPFAAPAPAQDPFAAPAPGYQGDRYAPAPGTAPGAVPSLQNYMPQPAPGYNPNQPYGQAQDFGMPPKKKSKAPLIIGIVVGVLVLVGIGIGVLMAVTNSVFSSTETSSVTTTPPPASSTTPTPAPPSDPVTPAEPTVIISGEVIGEVGVKYETKWFTFTIESINVAQTYGDYTAAEGNALVIAHVSLTNTSGAEQPFGTFDWLVDDDSLLEYIYPLDYFTEGMMPDEFELLDGESASYDVVIEFSDSLNTPYFMYLEVDDKGTTYGTFKLPL